MKNDLKLKLVVINGSFYEPVVVAAEDDSDNVLADIMDVTFHRR